MKRWIHIELCLARNFHSHVWLLKASSLHAVWNCIVLGGKYCKQHCWALRLSLHKTGKVIFVVELGSGFTRAPTPVTPSPTTSSTPSSSLSGPSSSPSSSGLSIEYKLETVHQVLLFISLFILQIKRVYENKRNNS